MSRTTVEGIYQEIGKRIKGLRSMREPRISQLTLAKKVGLSRVSIANIESGRQRVQVHVLLALANALGVASHELLPAPTASTNLPSSFLQTLKPQERSAVERLVRNKQKSHAS